MTLEPSPLWDGPELAAAVQGMPTGTAQPLPVNLPINGVSIDTRSIVPNDLFVALVGPNRDGHDFVADALEKGATTALVLRAPPGLRPNASLLVVEDTQAALERLGAAGRFRTAARIAAVTGSVGKTGTKAMLELVLSAQGRTHASAGSYNNLWGVPLSLARMPRDTEYGIFEIGMNHAGEITPLTHLVRPDVAIVTAIEPVHLEFFSGIEAIADAKAEIFQGVPEVGAAVINQDSPMFDRLHTAATSHGIRHIHGFGAHDQAYARLIDLKSDADGSRVIARLGTLRLSYRLSQPGRHLVMNSLAVLAAADALGADPVAAARALERFDGVAGRGRRISIDVPGGTAILIDESYNASPASVRAALAVLGGMTPAAAGRRIAVLGDMRELGETSAELHRALAADIVEAGVDLLFACGPLTRGLYEATPRHLRAAWAPTAAELAPRLADCIRSDDLITIKGSLGSRMADIVRVLRGTASC